VGRKEKRDERAGCLKKKITLELYPSIKLSARERFLKDHRFSVNLAEASQKLTRGLI